MKRISLLSFLCLISFANYSQTFTSTTGTIPDNSCNTAANDFPIVVSGIGVLGTTKTFDQLEINVTMASDADLDISLIAPNGKLIPISWGEGDHGDNFTNTIFRADATKTLKEGSAPFTGIYFPDGELDDLMGVQANGTWKLRICDTGPGDVATLNSCKLTFVNYVAPTCAEPPFVYSTKIGPTSVYFYWGAVSGSTNYYYVFNTSPAYPAGIGTATKATDFTATNLLPETSYYLHVRNDCGAILGTSKWPKAVVKTPPVNDDCVNAIKMTSLPYNKTQDILGANYKKEFIMNCGNGMNDGGWFSFYLTSGGNLKFDLTNIGAWNPEIAVFKGTCANLTCVGSADAAGLRGSESLSLSNLTPGQYFVAIGDGSGTTTNDEGRFTLDVTGTAVVATLSADSFDKSNFSYYPNPVKNKLNLSYNRNISHLAVYNALGQQVLEKEINAAESQVDMSFLPVGTYVIKVTADDQIQAFKVIKEE